MKIPTLADAQQAGIPRLHPNGFIQLDLDNKTRLHVWPYPRIPAQKTRHTVHDHRFSMRSEVICGELEQIEFIFMPLGRRDETTEVYPKLHRLHETKPVGGEDTILVPCSDAGWLGIKRRFRVRAGFGYGFGAKILHDSAAGVLTATLMTKVWTDRSYRARVAVPTDIKPDNDFRRTVDEDILWRSIDLALCMARK